MVRLTSTPRKHPETTDELVMARDPQGLFACRDRQTWTQERRASLLRASILRRTGQRLYACTATAHPPLSHHGYIVVVQVKPSCRRSGSRVVRALFAHPRSFFGCVLHDRRQTETRVDCMPGSRRVVLMVMRSRADAVDVSRVG